MSVHYKYVIFLDVLPQHFWPWSPCHSDGPNTYTSTCIQTHNQLEWVCFTHLFVCVFMFVCTPHPNWAIHYAVGIITASPANNDNGAGDYQGARKERRVGERGVWISLDDKRLHNLVSFFLLVHCIYPSSHTFLHPSISSLFSIFPHYVPSAAPLAHTHTQCNLPPPPPSLFLANLKFVRRLRLLDGWPLIFCELHLAQTSLRPWCILLTAALVAGPRHLS